MYQRPVPQSRCHTCGNNFGWRCPNPKCCVLNHDENMVCRMSKCQARKPYSHFDIRQMLNIARENRELLQKNKRLVEENDKIIKDNEDLKTKLRITREVTREVLDSNKRARRSRSPSDITLEYQQEPEFFIDRRPSCKFYKRGVCKKGSHCKFSH